MSETLENLRAAKKRTEAIWSISNKLIALEREAMDAGLNITARALNNAKNCSGWEATGNLAQATAAASRDMNP